MFFDEEEWEVHFEKGDQGHYSFIYIYIYTVSQRPLKELSSGIVDYK